MTESLKAHGWMGCAIQTIRGDFLVAQISDDSDGVARFHIDKERRFVTAEEALAFAQASRGSLSYRDWSHTYRIEDEPSVTSSSTG